MTRTSITRRDFLTSASALGAASLLGIPAIASAEPKPEIATIRLNKIPAICLAPEYLAEELLLLEGFSKVEFVGLDQNTSPDLLMSNQADISIYVPPSLLPDLDANKPVTALAGLHGGCFELFGHENVPAIRDLRGRRVAVSAMNSTEYYFLAAMLAYVGIDPLHDIDWIDAKSSDAMMQLFIDGKVDAVLAFPPQPQDLRAIGAGRVIVNTGEDRPWSQYYCCMAAARQEFVSKYPVATKRAVRALLKAADICATDPERAARYMVDKGYESRYEVALEVISSLSYARWRTHDPADSLRFYGVRMHEVGMIKTPPNELIAEGTDWRFLNEVRKELKA